MRRTRLALAGATAIGIGLGGGVVDCGGTGSSPGSSADGGSDSRTGADARDEPSGKMDADHASDRASGDVAKDKGDTSPLDAAGDAPSTADAADTGSGGDTGIDTGLTPTCHALRINQSNANISAPTTGWNVGTGDWTLEAWIKPHDAFAGGEIIDLNESDLTNEVRLMYDSTTGDIECTTYSGSCPCGKGTGNLNLTSGAINDDAWHHVACVRAGGNGILYIDGRQVDTDIITTSMIPASDIGIGQPTGYPSYQGAPVLLGPIRFSSIARYATAFTPTATWTVDSSTVTLYLVADAFTGTLIDEAGGDNTSSSASGVIASSDAPPLCGAGSGPQAVQCSGSGSTAKACGNGDSLPAWTYNVTYIGGAGSACATIGGSQAGSSCVPCTLSNTDSPQCTVSISPWTLSYDPVTSVVFVTEVSTCPAGGSWTPTCH